MKVWSFSCVYRVFKARVSRNVKIPSVQEQPKTGITSILRDRSLEAIAYQEIAGDNPKENRLPFVYFPTLNIFRRVRRGSLGPGAASDSVRYGAKGTALVRDPGKRTRRAQLFTRAYYHDIPPWPIRLWGCAGFFSGALSGMLFHRGVRRSGCQDGLILSAPIIGLGRLHWKFEGMLIVQAFWTPYHD